MGFISVSCNKFDYCFFTLVYNVLNQRFLPSFFLGSGSTAVFIGHLTLKGTEFVFNNDATISGNPGIITMCVSDKEGKFSRDTQKISLKPGQSVLFLFSRCDPHFMFRNSLEDLEWSGPTKRE